jgi:protein transport protein SEC24
LDEIDFSIQCNPAFMQASVKKIISSQNTANATKLPLGIVCKPMAGDKGITNDAIEVVDFGSTGIVRCKRCRTYVNPFVSWVDNGRRWRCNICGMLNDVPSSYFSHLDASGRRRDRDQRPELCHSSVEFIAPGDYMVRPPQPPVYFFVIDVSAVSAQSGMLQWCVDAIKGSLDELPGNPRTQIGFITFDTTIHFYNLKSSLTAPQMLVVSDVTDVIMPLPEDLLVNLQESRAVVDALLDALPTMFSAAKSTAVNTCTGPALMAAKRVIQHVGGKLCLFQSSLPSIGEGSLKPRDNPRLLGTDKEHMLLNAEDP